MGFDDGLAFGLADDEGGDCTWTDGNWTGFCDVIMGGFGLVIGLEDDAGGCTWTDSNWTGFCDVIIGAASDVEELVVIGRFSIGWVVLVFRLEDEEGGCCI